MTKEEKIKFIYNLHVELGPQPMSLLEKCKEIVDRMEESKIFKTERSEERSTKGVF